MIPDDWHLTDDVDAFLASAGAFLRSRPALHTTQLTAIEKLRTGGAGATTLFGRLESGGEVRATFHRPPSRRLTLTSLSPERADALAGHLTGLGHAVTGVVADHATAFAESWRRLTGASPAPTWRARLYRLATLTPPRPFPGGRGRAAAAHDHGRLLRWCGEFAATVGEAPLDTDSWAASRFADKRFTFWEAPDGTPVSMAATTSPLSGMIRVDPVYTPARHRGHGYGAAVTTEVTRSALAAAATDVVLFADPANPTSNALYQRLGYRHLADFTGYTFTGV